MATLQSPRSVTTSTSTTAITPSSLISTNTSTTLTTTTIPPVASPGTSSPGTSSLSTASPITGTTAATSVPGAVSTLRSSSKSRTSNPSSTVTPAAISKGVPTGTVVGVGFGTAFAGAFLALLVIWIFLRRSRRSRRAGENSWLSNTDHMGKFGGFKDNTVGKGVSNSIVALADIPLDPADDSQIRNHMQDLYELIHQHVENHYSTRNFQGRPEDLRRELAKCGWSDQTEPSAQTIASLLINPVTRRVAIRHVIAWIILQHVDLESSPETSLLSTHIIASGQAILKIKRTPGEQEVFSNSFTKWRHLTASLLPPLSSRPDNLESDSNLRPAVIRNVELLNGILQPFTKSVTEAQLTQSDNLASIILEGAHFGILLFSQPSLWIFGWEGKNLNQGGKSGRRFGAVDGSANKLLVVFPSIGKVITRDGNDHLRVVVDAMLERV